MEYKGTIKRFFGKGVYPPLLSFWLDFPLRRLILSPRKLADRLHLKEDSRVLERGLHNVGFTQGDATDLPFGENAFDAVFLVAVLGEVSNKEKSLCAIYDFP